MSDTKYHKHTPSDTNKNYWSEILDLRSIFDQAKFADQLTQQNLNSREFHITQLTQIQINPQFSKWNRTTLGNVSLLASEGLPEYRTQFRKFYEDFILWKRKQLTKKNRCIIS